MQMNVHVNDKLDTPLCVDLDGTLARSDTLWESVLLLIKENPLILFSIVMWLFQGKAAFKAKVAENLTLDPSFIAYNEDVVAFVRAEHEKGRETVLVTGTHQSIAESVSEHLGVFSNVFASNSKRNNVAGVKRDQLVELYGEGGFDYMGNSRDDVPVFEKASHAYVVAPDSAAARWQRKNKSTLIADEQSRLFVLFKALRVHQWLKNTLVIVPMFLSHMIGDPEKWAAVIVAFFAFSFMSSGVYLINDMMDLGSDRQHPRKRNRPLASGTLSIPTGLLFALCLACASVSLAAALSFEFLLVVLAYAVATTLYSLWLKRKLLVDVFTLAGLFTSRVIAGTIAAQVAHSYWLLAFSLFFFLSLALVKRYSELHKETQSKEATTAGRGYYAIDFEMIGQAGISSAFAASLVMALYIDLQAAKGTYATPWLLWPVCPIILFLLLRIWMLARRGFMDDDPLVFLLRDWRSQIIGSIGALFLIAATIRF